jgi:hypothetical protein
MLTRVRVAKVEFAHGPAVLALVIGCRKQRLKQSVKQIRRRDKRINDAPPHSASCLQVRSWEGQILPINYQNSNKTWAHIKKCKDIIGITANMVAATTTTPNLKADFPTLETVRCC